MVQGVDLGVFPLPGPQQGPSWKKLEVWRIWGLSEKLALGLKSLLLQTLGFNPHLS